MTLLSSSVSVALYAVLPIIGLIIGAVAGWLGFRLYSKKKLGDAKQTANKMLEDAVNEVKEMRKVAQRESQEELAKERGEMEKSLREKQANLSRSEQRIQQREDTLDKKEQNLDKKSEELEHQRNALSQKHAEADKLKAELANANSKIQDELQHVAGLTKDEAKNQLIDAIRDEAKRDAAKMVREIDAEAREEADKKAQKIVALAVQRDRKSVV